MNDSNVYALCVIPGGISPPTELFFGVGREKLEVDMMIVKAITNEGNYPNGLYF